MGKSKNISPKSVSLRGTHQIQVVHTFDGFVFIIKDEILTYASIFKNSESVQSFLR